MSDATFGTFLLYYLVTLIVGCLVFWALMSSHSPFILYPAIAVGVLWFRFLLRERDREKEKLSAACSVLLRVAFSKCSCRDASGSRRICADNAINIQDLAERARKEPKRVGLRAAIRMGEKVVIGEPGETHSQIEARMKQPECEVCHARAVLAEEYPGEIEWEIRIRESYGCHIPEDLFTDLQRFYGRKERSNER
jgi:hypothetical protein